MKGRPAAGTGDAAADRAMRYAGNAMRATLKEGEDALTAFEYGGFGLGDLIEGVVPR